MILAVRYTWHWERESDGLPERNGHPPTIQRPATHLGFVFSGQAAFEGRASSFLAEGFACGERLIYVADNPKVRQWPKRFLDRRDLLIFSTSEIYGPERSVVAAAQRATFQATLDEALGDGYAGLRVVADNTSLIATGGQLAAWLEWEAEADRFMAENPVTGLCAFDAARADAGDLRKVMNAHRVTAPPSS